MKKINLITNIVFIILLIIVVTVSLTYCGQKDIYKNKKDYKTEQYKQFNINSLRDLKYSSKVIIEELKVEE